MSSLLDILHKRSEPPEPLAPPGDEPEAQALPTLELRLAVDNGVAADDPWAADDRDQPATTMAGPTSPADLMLPAREPESRAPGLALAGDPTPVGPPPHSPGAATPEPAEFQTSIALARRSKRSTALLVAGLVAIVAAVLAGAWALQDLTSEQEDSMFVPGGAGPAAVPSPGNQARGSVTRPENLVPASGREQVPPPPAAATEPPPEFADEPSAPSRKEVLGGNTDWYETPAVEAGPGAAEPEPEPEPVAKITITRGTTENLSYPKLSAAWNAFRSGDYGQAEALYREVLGMDASNVDALLGIAAVAARGGRMDEARSGYDAVLRADPKNAAAVAALSMLPSGTADASTESTLKTMLRDQPNAASLYFALGLKYVAAGRWPDAQGAFFDAVRTDPANADYAYNLAVSLDQLGQKAPAATYYERALQLATDNVLFDRSKAEQRLARLQAPTP